MQGRSQGNPDIPHKRVRTAIANGKSVLEGVDGRCHVARRYRELGALISSDMGGHDQLTEAQRQLVRCAAGLVVLRERLDVKAANGEKVDSGEYCTISNTLRRVLLACGLKRIALDVTPLRAAKLASTVSSITLTGRQHRERAADTCRSQTPHAVARTR
jgi:hypothetical protein